MDTTNLTAAATPLSATNTLGAAPITPLGGSTTSYSPTTPLGRSTASYPATTPLGGSTTSYPATTPLAATSSPLTTGTGTAGFGAAQKILGSSPAASVLAKGDQALAARFLGTSDGKSARSIGDGRSSVSAARLLGSARPVRGQSDDTELSKRILETHESDDRGLPVKPVLHIIDVIFYRAAADLPGYIVETDQITTDEKVLYSAASLQDSVEIPSRITSAISCEIFSKCSAGVDVHTIVMDILNLIKHYSWESKVVLALVSFAVTYGEFRIVLQQHPTNPLAKAVALLKQLPEVLEHAAALKPKLDALHTLIKEIIDVTKKIVEFYDLPRDYFASDSPEILAAVSHIPTAVYWSIRSIVVSATQILSLTGMGIEYLTEPWELSSLAHKLNNIKGHLVDIIERCYKYIEKKRDDEAYEIIVRTFTITHIDNSRPLRVLFKEDPQAFYDCYNKRRIATEDLRRKVVALFITGIDPELTRTGEYAILQQIYMEKRHSLTRSEGQYEVIWVPVADIWTEDKYRLFESLRNQMDWYSVHHPSLVSPLVLRFFREKWNFSKKPLVVVMDNQGRITHDNAIHVMCIWGGQSYPFSINREKLLWDETSWTIDLLADGLEPNIATWINEGRYVCLYGGDEIEWIRKFTRIAKDVARESGITLELVYVGKDKPKERITRNIIDSITKENLSRTLDWNLIWYFWLRLESMWHSKGRYTNQENVKNDLVMQGIIAMLSYGSSSQGFAVITHGYSEMVKGSGEHIFKVLAEHGRWRTRETEIGFVPALDEYLRQIHLEAPHHCTSLILPGTGAMPDAVACAECGRLMERFTMFRCCLD